jgi:hypothetical protein
MELQPRSWINKKQVNYANKLFFSIQFLFFFFQKKYTWLNKGAK